MNKYKILLITIIFFIIGSFFFAYQNEIIVFRFPSFKKEQIKKENKIIKKNINLYFWQNEKWHNESVEIIWTDFKTENCSLIISNWLNLLDDEKILDKKVSLQHCLLSINGQEIYLSFDRSLFNEEYCTFEKLMIIEAMLKTLRENDLDIQKIWFLVHNQEMRDSHLDFSHGWSINGFLH